MKLMFFFTRGMSLENWLDKGIFDREKEIFEKYADNDLFEKIYWVSFGVNDRKLYAKLIASESLSRRIEIIAPSKLYFAKIGRCVYFLLFPFRQWQLIKHCDFFRTNQVDGVLLPLYCKLFSPAKLYFRCGWIPSKSSTGFRKWYFKFIEKLGYKFADFASVSNEADYLYIEKNYGKANIAILGNYINTAKFKISKPIQKRAESFLFVGRFSKQKNIEILLNLFCEAPLSRYNLSLYGEGEMQGYIELFIKKRNITNIRLMGKLFNDKLPEIYNEHKYYIQLSTWEGMPKTVLEAMACGCICFCSDIAGFQQIMKNKSNGILLSELSGDEISSILKQIELISEEMISVNASDYIQHNFSLDKYFENEYQYYIQ